VAPGDRVEKGQVICIIEAMKLMNEIEADASGEVVKCLVSNGQPIEFGAATVYGSGQLVLTGPGSLAKGLNVS